MDNFVLELMNDFGYLGMFLGMVLEAVIIIIPSELILATGGILASHGIFSFWGAFIIGLLGSVFCAIVLYFIGYFGGLAFTDKYGKYIFLKSEDLKKSDSWFNKYGLWAALIGRNFPIIRTLISLPMGIMKAPFFKFVLYTFLGSVPWTFVFVYVGYVLGNGWVILSEYTSKLKIPIRIIVVILVVSFVYKKVRHLYVKKKKLH